MSKRDIKINIEVHKVVVIAVLVVLMIPFIYNVFTDWREFLSASFSELLNIAVVCLLIFYLAERHLDEQKQKEVAVKLIEGVLLMLEDERWYIINDQSNVKWIQLMQRELFNSLKDIGKFGYYKNEYNEYLENEFNYYWDFISDHLSDIDYLKKSSLNMLKHISNIRSKLRSMIAETYV